MASFKSTHTSYMSYKTHYGRKHSCQIKEASITPEATIYIGIYMQKMVMASTVGEI